MSFLKKDIDKILNTNDVNKSFQKIMSIYDMMIGRSININNCNYDDEQLANTQTIKTSENNNEIVIKIKIEQNDVNSFVYFLDNTQESDGDNYYENKWVKHNHDNLKEINDSNTILIIDGKTLPFQKYFIPKKSGIYLVKLIFKNKLYNCAYMFCQSKNIIDIDFSKFNTENVTNMSYMFHNCSSLKTLILTSFKTKNVTNMRNMFKCCSLLTSLNLQSFNTENVISMTDMFCGCSSLTSINLSSFNTQKVTDMGEMFCRCKSLSILDLRSFNTQNVIGMSWMFHYCSSLTAVNLSSFNTQKVTDMSEMFYECKSLTVLDLRSFNADKADIGNMFYGCRNLSSCLSFDKKIIGAFNKN